MKDPYQVEMGNKAHGDIPGNPSTATSSSKKLNDRKDSAALNVFVGTRLGILDPKRIYRD